MLHQNELDMDTQNANDEFHKVRTEFRNFGVDIKERFSEGVIDEMLGHECFSGDDEVVAFRDAADKVQEIVKARHDDLKIKSQGVHDGFKLGYHGGRIFLSHAVAKAKRDDKGEAALGVVQSAFKSIGILHGASAKQDLDMVVHLLEWAIPYQTDHIKFHLTGTLKKVKNLRTVLESFGAFDEE